MQSSHMTSSLAPAPANSVELNLELNILDEEQLSFPILSRNSNIYSNQNICVLHSFTTAKDFSKKLKKWFYRNSHCKGEDKFQKFESRKISEQPNKAFWKPGI